ncbi:nicotinate-nucleotide--dimethylbenzimidazole phosphoribosyltransferase, partial [Micromonospora sp. AMSO1212t]
RLAADVLGLTPLVDLRLDLGEGATALAALPLLRSALTLAATLLPGTGAGELRYGHVR